MPRPSEFHRLSKKQLLEQLRSLVSQDLSQMTHSQQATVKGTTHEESRAENDKDTRAIESSYLARGQAERVAELQEAATSLSALQLREYDASTPLGPTALFSLIINAQGKETTQHYFLLPVAGGYQLQHGAIIVKTVTSKSPLGAAVLGKRLDDDLEFSSPQGSRECSLVALV